MTSKSLALAHAMRALLCICAIALAACNADTPESLIASGKTYAAKNDHKAAVIQFKAALQLSTENGEARYLLGQALLDAGDPAGAVLELSKALDQKHAVEKVMPALSRAMLLTGDNKKLTALYGEMVIADKAGQAALKANLATAWGALGDKAKTESNIAAALAAVPDYGPAQILNARLLAGRREFDAALALVNKVLAREPKLHDGWFLKGEILQVSGADDRAVEESFRKALAIEKSYVPAHLALIAMRLRERDTPGAKAQAEQLRAVLPGHPQTLFVNAQIAYADRDLPKAREIAQQLLRVAPNHVGVLQLAGVVEGQLGSLLVAESFFLKALAINPNLTVARRNLAHAYIRLGQPAKALEAVQPLLNGEPPNAEAHALAGDAQLRLGNADAAEGHYTRAAKIDPDDTRLRTAVALTRLSRGEAAGAFAELESLAQKSVETYADQAIVSARMKRREFDAALGAANRLIAKQPENAGAFDLLGRVQAARRQYADARKAFERALEIDPAFFASTSNLAGLDILDKRPDLARKRLESSIAADPKNHYASSQLVVLLAQQDAPLDELRSILTAAIKNSPMQSAPRLQLIDLTLRKRLFKEALVVAQEAAAALPNDAAVLYAAGRAQAQAGNLEQAISTYRTLASINPNSASAYLHLAEVYGASGKRDSAGSALKKAFEIEPDRPAVQTALLEHLLTVSGARGAIELGRTLQQQHPKKDVGYLFEAAGHLRSKALDAAFAAYRKGLSAGATQGELPKALYTTQVNAGRNADADRFANGWLKEHPEDAAFEFQMASVAINRGELEQAETHLKRVLSKRPNNPLALNNLAWTLVGRGKPGAVEHAQKAVTLMPDQPALIDTLALALAADKQFDKALIQQKRAVELAPENNGLRLHLAKIALKAGDKTVARAELDRLQKLGTVFPQQAEVANLMITVQ